MKKTITLILSIISLFSLAQVPQGVGYQGVATDGNGIELVNQSISIRASVISGSANGTVEWQETHATTTDTFGLFTITIGQGTSTGNGIQADFADISWGINTHFLKIEMDVTGGTNYSFMGTNQMMSVPYALYAESANISYDSIANYLSGDTTFITNVSSGLASGGCDILFPDGLDGDPIHWSFDYQGSYTVPAGKTLYMLKDVNWDGTIIVNGITSNISVYWNSPLIIGENSIVDDNPGDGNFYGFLVDKKVTPVTWSFTQGNYTVPPGKILYILKESSWNGIITVNGFTYQTGLEIGKPLIIGENGIIDAGSGFGSFNGYLIDENYFADCGGGNSSSSSIIDSSYIDSLVQIYSSGNGSGCDFLFPQGFHGQVVNHDLENDYVVPTGKNLYLSNLWLANSSSFIKIDGVKCVSDQINASGNNDLLSIVAGEGQVISSFYNSSGWENFIGILIDKSNITPLTHNLSSPYTVPVNRKLFITSLYNTSNSNQILIDGNICQQGNSNNTGSSGQIGNKKIVVSSGSVVTSLGGYECSFNGYLADENYFANCGGDNSSSSSVIDSSYIDSLVQFYTSGNGGGCDFYFPDGFGDFFNVRLTINQHTYTVPAGKRLYITHLEEGNDPLFIDGIKIWSNLFQPSINYPIIVEENSIISKPPQNSSLGSISVRGFLVNSSSHIDPVTDGNTNYIVPSGKLLIVNFFGGKDNTPNPTNLGVGSFHTLDEEVNFPIILYPNDTLVTTGDPNTHPNGISFNGYLVDENYFANCGGGNSSSSSVVDSSYIDSLVQFYSTGNGDGCNYSWPEGLKGEPITHYLTRPSNYSVPQGKTLYITNWFSNGTDDLEIEFNPSAGRGIARWNNNNTGEERGIINPIILRSSDIISTSGYGGTGYFNGILIDSKTEVEPISIELTNSSSYGINTYTVPNDKLFVILNAAYYYAGPLTINGMPIFNYSGHNNVLKSPIFAKSGDIIEAVHTSINGYLVDEDYFANCEGGGSSTSSSNLDSLTIVTMINNITNSNQSFGLSVGDYFQGGIVAYIFQPGDSSYVPGEIHGYVAYSDGSTYPWGCNGMITSVNNTSVGQGPNNTNILNNLCPEPNFAAKWCNDLAVGIYDDWFLPTSEEMLLAGLSFIKDYFGDYIHYWISEEYSVSNNNNFSSSTHNSSSHAFTYYIDGNPSMNINCLNKNSLNKVIAFREF